jgi:hypothetical protein
VLAAVGVGAVECSTHSTAIKASAHDVNLESMQTNHIIRLKEFLLGIYDRLPWRILTITEPIIYLLKSIISFLLDIRVDALIFYCQLNPVKEPLFILYIGKKGQKEFVMDFSGATVLSSLPLGHLFFWQILRFLEQTKITRDLTIVHINLVFYRLSGLKGFLNTPDHVKSILYFSNVFQGIKKQFRGNALRKIQKVYDLKYTWSVFFDRAALDHFYFEMYRPYITKRFGERAIIDSYQKVKRLIETGFLVVVQKEDQRMAAAICRVRNNTLVFELVGVEKGKLEYLNEGAFDALYYYCILIAHEKKCSSIDFGKSRPFLDGGLIRYKNLWGSTLVPNKKQYKILGVRIHDPNKTMGKGLLEQYLIFFDKGGLSSLLFLADQAPIHLKYMEQLKKRYHTPGIMHLYAWAPKGFDQEVSQYERRSLDEVPGAFSLD